MVDPLCCTQERPPPSSSPPTPPPASPSPYPLQVTWARAPSAQMTFPVSVPPGGGEVRETLLLAHVVQAPPRPPRPLPRPAARRDARRDARWRAALCAAPGNAPRRADALPARRYLQRRHPPLGAPDAIPPPSHSHSASATSLTTGGSLGRRFRATSTSRLRAPPSRRLLRAQLPSASPRALRTSTGKPPPPPCAQSQHVPQPFVEPVRSKTGPRDSLGRPSRGSLGADCACGARRRLSAVVLAEIEQLRSAGPSAQARDPRAAPPCVLASLIPSACPCFRPRSHGAPEPRAGGGGGQEVATRAAIARREHETASRCNTCAAPRPTSPAVARGPPRAARAQRAHRRPNRPADTGRPPRETTAAPPCRRVPRRRGAHRRTTKTLGTLRGSRTPFLEDCEKHLTC